MAGRPARALRVSFVGELGWELHVPAAGLADVYAAVKAAVGGASSDVGYRAMDSLSLEKGYPHWHADVRTEDNPLEACLAFTCKLKSGTDFLGRRRLEEIRSEGGARKRKVCFTVEGYVKNILEKVPFLKS